MKNIMQILADIGVEIPAEKMDTAKKEIAENYRTIEDYTKAVEKRDEYKTSLETVQGKLKAFDGVDLDKLKGQIKTLELSLQEEKDARAADALKVELEKNVDSFLGEKKFVNTITQETIKSKLMEELNKDTAKGKGIGDIFTLITSDKDGNPLENILIDESQQQAQQNKATFTTKVTGHTPPAGTKLSTSELMKLKNQNPDIDIQQYM